eukprot:gene18936-biopygen12988
MGSGAGLALVQRGPPAANISLRLARRRLSGANPGFSLRAQAFGRACGGKNLRASFGENLRATCAKNLRLARKTCDLRGKLARRRAECKHLFSMRLARVLKMNFSLQLARKLARKLGRWHCEHPCICKVRPPQGSQDSGAGVARAWRGRGAGCRPFLGLGGAGVARAWRGRGAGMSCDPRE